MVGDFLKGFNYFFEGFKLIRAPALRRFVWVPLLCNIVLFLLMFIFAAYGLNIFSEWVQHFLPNWLQWLRWFVWILSILFSAIGLLYLSSLIVNIIAGPFNSVLSEKVLMLLSLPDKSINTSFLQSIPASFLRQMRFIVYYLPRALFYLVLFIVPVVQVLAAFFWFVFNGWVFTMQYLDYPMENHGITIKQMRELMRQRRWVCLGFGSGVMLIAIIPFINFIVVPIAVIGATVLFANEFRSSVSQQKI